MKYLFFAIFFSVLIYGQKIEKEKINIQLKNELAQIDYDDQIYRVLMQPDISLERKQQIISEKKLTEEQATVGLWKVMQKQDDENLGKIEEILAKYGYPGKSLVGEPENKTAWIVIQHSAKIKQYLPIIKEAAEKKEIPFTLYAMMLDRQLMQEEKEQIYGTQGTSFNIMKSGVTETISLIWPIKNFNEVNKLRKEAGFSETIDSYAKDLFGNDFVLKNYTLEEVLKLRNKNKK